MNKLWWLPTALLACCLIGCDICGGNSAKRHDLVKIAGQGRKGFLSVLGAKAVLDHQHLIAPSEGHATPDTILCYVVSTEDGLAIVAFRNDVVDGVFWTARKTAINKLRDVSVNYFSRDVREQ